MKTGTCWGGYVPKNAKTGTRWLECVPKNGFLGTYKVQLIRLTVYIVPYCQAVKRFVKPPIGSLIKNRVECLRQSMPYLFMLLII